MDAVSPDPRIERTRELVLTAAVEIVAERGFSGATIDAIARRSGVARSTIYRHWSQRMDLLLEAVGREVGSFDALKTGSLRQDLVTISTHLSDLLASEPVGSVTASLILESRRDPSLDELRERFIEQRRTAATHVIYDALGRGELPMDVKVPELANDLAAPIFFQCLVLHTRLSQEWIAAHVDRCLQRFTVHRDYEGVYGVD